MGLIAYYPFKNGSLENIVNGSIATNNGALFNNTLGKDSYYFSGIDDGMNVGTCNLTDNYTVSIWFYKSSWGTDSWETLFSLGGAELETKNGANNIATIVAYSWGGGTFTYDFDKWNHLVMTRNATETKYYLNNELRLTGKPGSYGNINILLACWNLTSRQNYKGYISNFRVYNHILSQTEITQLYTASNPQTKIDLIAHYPLNGDTVDYSGNGFNATNSGATIDNNGKIGKCYSFTSYNTITTNNTNLNNLEHFTICLWHYFTDATYPRTFSPIHKNNGYTYLDGISNRGWDFGHGYSSSSVSVYINDGVNKVSSGLTFDVGNRPSDLINKWVHLTYEVNRIDKKVYAYVNGVKQSNYVDISNITGSISNNAVLKIGELYGWYLIGKLNDVRVYNGILSPKEIKEIAKAKILHYNFNDFQEPTTNLVTNQNFSTDWSGSNPPLSVSNGVGIFSEANGDQYWFNLHNFGVDISGRIFTASCKIKTIDCEKPKGISIYWADANNNFIFQNTNWIYMTSQNSLDYEFLTVSGTAPAGAYRALFFIGMYYTNVTDTNGRMYIKECMLEEKDHATPYVPTSRIGQVQDSSGYRNHADLTIATTPQYTSLSKLGTGGYYWLDTTKKIEKTINRPSEKITMNCWFKGSTQGGSGYNIPMSINGGEYEMSITPSGELRCGFYLSGTRYVYNWGSGLLNGNWHMLTTQYDGAYIRGFIDGVEVGNTNIVGNLTSNSGILRIGNYDGSITYGNINAYEDDIRIYATALSQEDITELYEVGQQIHNTGILETNQFIENGYGHTLVNYNKWVVGDFVYQDGWNNHWGDKPTQYSDLIALYSNPQGEQDLVYESKVLDNTFVMYRTRGLAATPTSLPDITKTYRLSYWVYISGNTTSGTSWYAGLDYSKVCGINTTTPDGNPYPHALGGGVSTGDKWILCVSYIYPYGSIGNVNNAKRYLPDGTIHSTGTDYNWNSGISSFFLRWLFNYQYDQPNVNQYTLLYRPRFDLIDGTEPTLQELLKCQDHKPFPLIRPEFSEQHYTYTNKYKEAFTTGITYIKDDNDVSQQLYCEYLEGQVYAKSNTTAFVVKGVTFSNYLQLIDTDIYKERVIANMDSNTIYVNELIEN